MERPPPKVFKVKDPDPDDKFSDIHPHLPQPPSLLLIVGSVKQGKSNSVILKDFIFCKILTKSCRPFFSFVLVKSV